MNRRTFLSFLGAAVVVGNLRIETPSVHAEYVPGSKRLLDRAFIRSSDEAYADFFSSVIWEWETADEAEEWRVGLVDSYAKLPDRCGEVSVVELEAHETGSPTQTIMSWTEVEGAAAVETHMVDGVFSEGVYCWRLRMTGEPTEALVGHMTELIDDLTSRARSSESPVLADLLPDLDDLGPGFERFLIDASVSDGSGTPIGAPFHEDAC